MLVWLNGRIVAARDAHISALDRGLLHGDGCYDTWRAYGGVPFATVAHLGRLARGARELGLPSPGDPATWHRRARRLVLRNRLSDAALRLTITRGATGETLRPARRGRPTLLLTVRRLPAELGRQQRDGIRAVLLPFSRSTGPDWAHLKLMSHASAIRGLEIAARHDAVEGLYVTADGEVTEGTFSNLFGVFGGMLVTPPLDRGILGGITRKLVLRLARRAGVPVREHTLSAARVAHADELFVTASTIEVLPVVRLGRRRVGHGHPGPITTMLQARYRAHAERACARATR